MEQPQVFDMFDVELSSDLAQEQSQQPQQQNQQKMPKTVQFNFFAPKTQKDNYFEQQDNKNKYQVPSNQFMIAERTVKDSQNDNLILSTNKTYNLSTQKLPSFKFRTNYYNSTANLKSKKLTLQERAQKKKQREKIMDSTAYIEDDDDDKEENKKNQYVKTGKKQKFKRNPLNTSLNSSLTSRGRLNNCNSTQNLDRKFSIDDRVLVAYNEQFLLSLKKNKRKKSTNGQLSETHSIILNKDTSQLELVDQKYLISSFFQQKQNYMSICKLFTSIRNTVMNQLADNPLQESKHYLLLDSTKKKIQIQKEELEKLHSQNVPEPYPQQIAKYIKILEAYQKQIDIIQIFREIQSYYNEEFVQLVQPDKVEENQNYLTKVLNSSIEQFKGKISEIMFQLKQGYIIYNKFSAQVAKIQQWLYCYFKFVELQHYFDKYSQYSTLKKTIRSQQLHEMHTSIENTIMEVLLYSDILPIPYIDNLNRMSQTMTTIKLGYFKFYSQFKKNPIYQNCLEIYDGTKHLKKAVTNYCKYKQNIQMQKELRQYLYNVLDQENKIQKKIVVLTYKEIPSDIEQLVNKFHKNYEKLEEIIEEIMSANSNIKQINTKNKQQKKQLKKYY